MLNINFTLMGEIPTAKFITVFKRYEMKYILSPEQYEALRRVLDLHMEVDRYGRTLIQNIYYDTPDFRLIRASIEKPLYKEKLRVRCYGECDDGHNVFVEIKKKFKGVVYKRRVNMEYAQALSYLSGGDPPCPCQITNEIDWFFKAYPGIGPAMYISYERVAMASREDPNLRVTFDQNITYRMTELDICRGSYGDKLIGDDCWLMEIKIPGAMPIWLVRALTELGIRPVSYSKYGNAYRSLLARKQITIGGKTSA